MYEIVQEYAYVEKIIKNRPGIQILQVKLEDENTARAVNYIQLTGKVKQGDTVLVNTTAVKLGLGTGGYHFVITVCSEKGNGDNNKSNNNKSNDISFAEEKGHIMKMRYTPVQMKTLSLEEKDSPYHKIFEEAVYIDGQTVILIPLHSLLAPVAFVFKYLFPEQKLVYIMTEGGSLALEFSHLVSELKEKGLIDSTITIGQSFGGDLEAVNVFTGLIAGSKVADADVIVAGMGPGITGTGTRLGFSGVEIALISYAVDVLGGKSILVPRVSLAEKRDRHYLLSHHTETLLNLLIKNSVDVVFPDLQILQKKIQQIELAKNHNIFFYGQKDMGKIENILQQADFTFNSMGRNFTDDPLFFITGGLAVLRFRDILREETDEQTK